MPTEKKETLSKHEVIEITREKISLLDDYISRKEREGHAAEPTLGADRFSQEADYQAGEEFVSELQALPPGRPTASQYQRLVYKILNYLFEPDLTDGQLEEPTHHGTERRDIVFANEAERSFLKYVRETYLSLFLLFEIKNTQAAELEHVNQVAAYLGSRLGMLGFIVTRRPADKNVILKTYSIYNDTPSMPRKTILIVSDDDLTEMIRLKQEGKSPVTKLQKIYRSFKLGLQ